MKRLLLALYRRALLLLPPAFRREWGGAMAEEARLTLEEARGGWGMLRAATLLVRDGVRTWGREWWVAVAGGQDGASAHGGARGEGLLRGLGRDVRTAVRSFRRAPLFTAVVVATLSLGIGADTAIFSVVDRALLRPLPYGEPEALVSIWPGTFHSAAHLDRLRSELRTLEGLAGYTGTLLTLSEGEPTELFGAVVTPGHFGVLGVEPALGRAFVAEDGAPGAEPVTILSHGLWLERFGADPSVLGRRVALQDDDEAARTVVGVTPAGHRALQGDVDAWIPFVTDPSTDGYVDSSSLELVGRLAEGADVGAAAREVRALAARMASEDPHRTSPEKARSATVALLADELVEDLRPHLLALLGAVAVVLLIACVNVANLMLVRTAARTRELAVRTALGAGRGRLARQLLVESALLGLAGGAGGLVVATLTRSLLVGAVPGGSEALAGATLDGRMLLFTAALSLAVGLLFGTAPAMRAAARSPGEALAGGRGGPGDRRSHRFHHLLVAGEVALTLAAVFSAGLLARSVWRVTAVDPGFETENVLTFRLTAPPASFPGDEDVLAYFREVVRRVEAVPGVRRAGAVSRLPMDGGISRISLNPDWYEIPEGEAPPQANHRLITEGYAEAMGFRLREGRFLGAEDREGPARGLVSAALADRWWPDGAVGRHIRGREGPWLTIVGVVEDVREDGLVRPPFPTVYIPHRDWAWRTMNVVVATAGPPMDILPSVKEAVWSIAPDVPVARARPMEDVVARSVRDTVLTARLFALFAALALVLAAVGVYGVVAYTIGTRRHELGVRSALGASASRVRSGALLRAAGPLGAGLLAGLAVTPLAGRLLGSFLHGLPAADPAALGASVLLLGTVGLLATWVPVRRATAVDPSEVLRGD